MINIAKIENDKYYTSPELAEYCVKKTKDIIGEENITEYLEPSAGNGVFLNYLPDSTLAYDIEPEDIRIQKQDYLTLDLPYKQGRCIIGNPPFSKDLNIAFYKKSINISDYIALIMPISQYKNNIKMYEFDLIYSENLGLKKYSNRNLYCCFNIYHKNPNGYNIAPNYKLKDIEIKRHIRKNTEIYKDDFDYDIRICGRGNIGCVVEYSNQFAREFCIKIHNEQYKKQVVNLINNTNWEKEYPSISTPSLSAWQIYKYIKEQIPEIQ